MRNPKPVKRKQNSQIHNDLDALLTAARNYLDITWEDPEGDIKLLGIIERGIRYIDGIAGREMNYMEAGSAQGLLFNYCVYERSSTLNDFQPNYLHELLALQLGVAAKRVKRGRALQSLTRSRS